MYMSVKKDHSLEHIFRKSMTLLKDEDIIIFVSSSYFDDFYEQWDRYFALLFHAKTNHWKLEY